LLCLVHAILGIPVAQFMGGRILKGHIDQNDHGGEGIDRG
jgi:hypothetical protein